MKIVLAHNTTQEKAISRVDKSADNFFDFGTTAVSLVDQKKTWTGPKMDFSLVAKAGFIALPVSGTLLVDDVNVTIDVELPALAKNFVGEDKIRVNMEQKVRGLLIAGS
jgi:hypothetical protein